MQTVVFTVGGREVSIQFPEGDEFPKHPVFYQAEISRLMRENEMLRIQLEGYESQSWKRMFFGVVPKVALGRRVQAVCGP